MNVQRRKQLSDLMEQIDTLKFALEEIKDDECGAWDNLPESLQESSRGEQMYENVETLESALDSLQDAIDYIQEAIDK